LGSYKKSFKLCPFCGALQKGDGKKSRADKKFDKTIAENFKLLEKQRTALRKQNQTVPPPKKATKPFEIYEGKQNKKDEKKIKKDDLGHLNLQRTENHVDSVSKSNNRETNNIDVKTANGPTKIDQSKHTNLKDSVYSDKSTQNYNNINNFYHGDNAEYKFIRRIEYPDILKSFIVRSTKTKKFYLAKLLPVSTEHHERFDSLRSSLKNTENNFLNFTSIIGYSDISFETHFLKKAENYLVLLREYTSYQSLLDVVKKYQKIGAPQAVNLISKIANRLKFSQHQHGGLKPENIFVSDPGKSNNEFKTFEITDYRLIEIKNSITKYDDRFRNEFYEQKKGDEYLSGYDSSRGIGDIIALGKILIHMINGESTKESQDEDDKYIKIAKDASNGLIYSMDEFYDHLLNTLSDPNEKDESLFGDLNFGGMFDADPNRKISYKF